MLRPRGTVLLGAFLLSLHALAAAPPGTSPLSGPGLTIESDSTCPSSAAVGAALSGLIPSASWPSGTVRIRSMTDTLVVELRSEGTTQRQVRVTADCGVRATTVALVIATWTGELASDAAGVPVLRSRTAGPPAATPSPAAGLPLAAPSSRNDYELGAGLLLAMWGGIAPGVRVDFTQTRAPSGLGWQMALALPTSREQGDGGLRVSWARAAASVALNGRLTLRRLIVAIDAGVAGGYTLTSGQGFSVEQGSQSLTAGLVGGLRVAWPWRRLRVFTDARAYRWLLPQTIAVDAAPGNRVATLTLPSTDLQWSVGIAYLLR